MTQEFDKKLHVAKCQHCGKITDIGTSQAVMAMVAKNRTMKEALKECSKNKENLRSMKNGQIQIMHKTIKQLMDLMTEEQKEKARGINQSNRDMLKKAESLK